MISSFGCGLRRIKEKNLESEIETCKYLVRIKEGYTRIKEKNLESEIETPKNSTSA